MKVFVPMAQDRCSHTARRLSGLRIVPVLSFIVLFLSCKGERGPAGPGLSGTIRGGVTLYDYNAWSPRRLADHGGVTVTLEPASISTTSRSDGSWEFLGVPAGTYVLRLTKPGFIASVTYNVSFAGGGTYFAGHFSMGQMPAARARNLTVARFDTLGTLVFSGIVSPPDSLQVSVVILFSKTRIDTTRPFGVLGYVGTSLDPGQRVFGPDRIFWRW